MRLIMIKYLNSIDSTNVYTYIEDVNITAYKKIFIQDKLYTNIYTYIM